VKTFIALLTTLPALSLGAQQALVGYTPAGAARERDLEASTIKRPSPTTAAANSKALSRETHVAGTPAQARTRDYVIAQMKSWGLETEVRGYDIWMPQPTSVSLSRVSPDPKSFALAEPPVKGDPTSALAQYPTVNGYSGQGDATAEVVYVNYGLIEDYAQLDSMGVSVKDRDRALRAVVPRHQGARGRETRRVGAAELQRSARRRLRRGRRVSRRADAKQQRGTARQHPQPGRRSVNAGIWKHGRRSAPPARQDGDLAHSGGADRLRQRERAAQVHQGSRWTTAAGRADSLSIITSGQVLFARASPSATIARANR
jgi:hypothetical protein